MSRGTQVPRTIEEHGPSPIARWGPMVAILASLALVAAVSARAMVRSAHEAAAVARMVATYHASAWRVARARWAAWFRMRRTLVTTRIP